MNGRGVAGKTPAIQQYLLYGLLRERVTVRWSYLARKKNFPKSHIINPLLTKFVRSRWLDIGLVLFCEFMDLACVSVHKHAKKERGQYPAILTSHLVNNVVIEHNAADETLSIVFDILLHAFDMICHLGIINLCSWLSWCLTVSELWGLLFA